ncbi:MAG: SdrD B-like domain-containing protein, partial [Thermodesulfobacteriota bacterium]
HSNVVKVTGEDVEYNQVTASDDENIQLIASIGGGGAISYLVWYDIDMDGVIDAGEPGIDGVSLELRDSTTRAVLATTTTAGGGRYSFNVANSTYEVAVTDQSHILDGSSLTTGANPISGIVINNQINIGTNFGYVFVDEPLPRVDIEKSTNGQDADVAPGPTLSTGQDVVWTYTVTNSGHFHLNNVTVSDDMGVRVSCPQDNLAVGETMSCTGTGSAVRGQYANMGSVSATAIIEGSYMDSDPSHYYVKPLPFIPPPPCATFPLYCYVIADRDTSEAQVDRLFKYTFREDRLEYLNHLGVIDVETMTLSLDGKTIYATNGGVLGTIDPTPGITDSFTPINPAGVGSGRGDYGTVLMADLDGIAFDPSTDALYATERYMEEDPNIMDLLIQIDPASGTIIRDAFGPGRDYVVIQTLPLGVTDADDIDIDASGQMYGVAGNSGGGGGDHGLLIDKATGAVSLSAPLHDATGSPVQDAEGFTIYNHNHYYLTTGIEFVALGTDNTLYKVDRQTGQTEKIIRLDQQFDGFTPIDFEGITCAPVCSNK